MRSAQMNWLNGSPRQRGSHGAMVGPLLHEGCDSRLPGARRAPSLAFSHPESSTMPKRFQRDFPEFYQRLKERNGGEIEEILPPASETELADIERRVGVPLPESYRRLLSCTRGFWLRGGAILFSLNLTSKEADPLVGWAPIARLLSLKQRAFWEAVHREGIPHYRINARVIRFRLSEVERWLQTRRIGRTA
jgi:predicted DNA-binding transcriptional regulator AlpA